MAVRASASVSQMLTDATLIGQTTSPRYLDTVGNETVGKLKTVRSLRYALRRVLADASDEKLFVKTLAGAQILAMSTATATAAGLIAAVQDVVTAAGSIAEPSPSADADIPDHDLKNLLSQVSVLYSDGRYYIDDIGVTGMFRPPIAKDLKTALRRVVRKTSTRFVLNTLSGLIAKAVIDLGTGTSAAAIKTAITDVTGVATTSSTTKASISTVPSNSTKEIFQKVLRKRAASNRNVIIDDVGTNTSVAGLRASHLRMLYDAMESTGDRIFTFSGEAMEAVAALDSGTAAVADIITAMSDAVA